ncbi:hypothetical protein OG216_19245 [Streptomycetaceae bacterium NBC_01309]
MTQPTPPPDHSTALELERLRGELSTGLAEIKGSLALLVQRSDQLDRTLAAHEQTLEMYDGRLDALEQWRSRVGGISVVLGTLGGAGAGAVISFLLGQ